MTIDAGNRFLWPDYIILVATLALSCAVGIYYGVKGRGKQSAEEFLMGGRNMQIIPVSLSLFVSWMSSIAFIADPVEIYYYGAVYIFYALGYCLAIPVVAHFFAPVYFQQKLTSIFEYLEMRYNFAVRLGASICLGIGGMLYLGVALFAPAVAVSQGLSQFYCSMVPNDRLMILLINKVKKSVSGLPVWSCILIIGFICMLYTTLGGIKAVIWADALQFLLMVAGLLTVVFSGLIQLGGFTQIWRIASAGNRAKFYEAFNPDPFERMTFWTLIIGGFFRVFNMYMSNQIWIQRYCTLRSERDVKLALYLNIPIFVLFVTLLTMCGLILYAMYHDCDPLTMRRITRPDQMMPLLVIDLLKVVPGLSGLFLGSVLAASLSSLSSGQSSAATTCLADLVAPFYHQHSGRQLSEKRRSFLAKLLSAAMGVANIIVALAIGMMLSKGSTIFQFAMAVVNAFLAPIAGIFILAVIFPSVDTASTLIGGGISTIISCWLTLGPQISGVRHRRLPTSVIGCVNSSSLNYNNISKLYLDEVNYVFIGNVSRHLQDYTEDYHLVTDSYNMTVSISQNNYSVDWSIYKFSPILYPAIGPVVCVVAALLISTVKRVCKRLVTSDSTLGHKTISKEINVCESENLTLLEEKSATISDKEKETTL